ncbi:DUF6287 domain-containing protein [Convivina intestini]|uniref:DUF6287 domain-containing protein n=1 Tax=Convivina intestini TaxID=1505726 RepID=UPI00200C8BA5|nr:DUF6287 domain-containing protein [Convivina intestini]CAH1855821.1 hypothetical protein R078131_01279 [Convivina intestini]
MNKKIVYGGLVLLVLAAGAGVYALNSHHSTNKETTKVKKQTSSTADKSSQSANDAMDLKAIQAGDYTSVAGTWKNSAGNTLVFDKKGLSSATMNGTSTTSMKIYTDSGSLKAGDNDFPINSKIEAGVLQAKLGTNPLPTGDAPSALVPFNFIPKGVDFAGSTDNDQDRIFSGQQMGENNIYTRQKTATKAEGKSNTDDLSQHDKEALALLALPDGFMSDFGNLTTDMILAGKSDVGSNALDEHGQKMTTVNFNGINIEHRDNKNLVRLKTVPEKIDNLTYTEGYFIIDGDTITYKNQGRRLQGKEQDEHAQQLGTQSLQSLYDQYKNNNKFKEMKNLVTD